MIIAPNSVNKTLFLVIDFMDMVIKQHFVKKEIFEKLRGSPFVPENMSPLAAYDSTLQKILDEKIVSFGWLACFFVWRQFFLSWVRKFSNIRKSTNFWDFLSIFCMPALNLSMNNLSIATYYLKSFHHWFLWVRPQNLEPFTGRVKQKTLYVKCL